MGSGKSSIEGSVSIFTGPGHLYHGSQFGTTILWFRGGRLSCMLINSQDKLAVQCGPVLRPERTLKARAKSVCKIPMDNL